MQYFGGKAKIANEVVSYLESIREPNQPYFEPFVGGANIISKMSGERHCSDFNEYLISLYQAVQLGYILPDSISEAEYLFVKNNKDNNKALTGFVGFGCSFAAKWFGGYARDKRKIRDYAFTAKKGLLKKMETMQDVVFSWKDYKTLNPKGLLIYCDPPYENTTGYSGTPKFNSVEFWDIMRIWSKDNTVIISEYKAPSDFICVLEIQTRTDIRNASGELINRCEKLFKWVG